MEQSKCSMSSDSKMVTLITEVVAEIDGKNHKFGYYSADGELLTLQKIVRNLSQGIKYLRQIEAIECRFIITTKDKFSISEKSMNLDEFSQLVALGIDSDLIASYVKNDPRMPKPELIVSLGDKFLLKPHSEGPIFAVQLTDISAERMSFSDSSVSWQLEGVSLTPDLIRRYE